MSKTYFFILLCFIFSCGGNGSDTEKLAVDIKYAEGKKIYDASCTICHMKDGKGLEKTFPPLANSDYLLENPSRALKQVVYGSSEKIIVNGVSYDGIMPPQNVTDEEAVDVVNYILNAWGNDGGEVSLEDLKEVKKNHK